MSEDQQVESRAPLGVSAKDEQPKGHCQVVCVLPELRTSLHFSGGKIIKRPAGGGVYERHIEKRSVSFTIGCKSKQKKPIQYEYSIKLLPDDIIPEFSKIKLEKGKVIMTLKKAEDKSWAQQIMSNGIDQYEEEEEESHKHLDEDDMIE